MIATAFNRYQDLNLVCNDAHFARYLLLEAAIAMLWVHSMPTSQSSLHQLRICGILTSHSSLVWFRVCGICITAGLVSFEFAAYLSLIPLCLGLAAYLTLEIALCSALLLAASLLPAILSVCSLAETSFFLVGYHSNCFSLARVALDGILVYTVKFRTFT